jgi:hypothetical protein
MDECGFTLCCCSSRRLASQLFFGRAFPSTGASLLITLRVQMPDPGSLEQHSLRRTVLSFPRTGKIDSAPCRARCSLVLDILLFSGVGVVGIRAKSPTERVPRVGRRGDLSRLVSSVQKLNIDQSRRCSRWAYGDRRNYSRSRGRCERACEPIGPKPICRRGRR